MVRAVDHLPSYVAFLSEQRVGVQAQYCKLNKRCDEIAAVKDAWCHFSLHSSLRVHFALAVRLMSTLCATFPHRDPLQGLVHLRSPTLSLYHDHTLPLI